VIRLKRWLPGVVLVLSGCATTSQVPEDRFYQIEAVAPSISVPRPVFSEGLDVDKVSADPLRSGRAVLYRDSRKPLEVKRYHYEFWVDQPPRMVHQALVDYLRASGVADPTGGGSRPANGNYALKAHLKRFDRVVGAGRPKVEIELQTTVYANGSRVPLWTNNYLHQQESDAGDMHATAAAMQIALANIFASMVEDLAAIGPVP
jgi:ABC-type uncharacterized transport system auxiliary subunit